VYWFLGGSSGDGASGGLAGWVILLFSGFGATILVLAVPALSKWIGALRERHRERKDARILEERKAREELQKEVDSLKGEVSSLKDSMAKVLEYIEGRKNPFTGEVEGGLVNTLREILALVGKRKSDRDRQAQ
jgi:hypothetical protein